MQNISKDPLHGKTLKVILELLVKTYGWDGLGKRIPVKCFTNHPTMNSSLTFLRKTGWAREKVETLYLGTIKRHHRDVQELKPLDLEL